MALIPVVSSLLGKMPRDRCYNGNVSERLAGRGTRTAQRWQERPHQTVTLGLAC